MSSCIFTRIIGFLETRHSDFTFFQRSDLFNEDESAWSLKDAPRNDPSSSPTDEDD
jgi:hypothetical protein